MEENKKMDREEKRGIFLGIIGVLTLIVAIIGASFAYFSVNAKSSDDAVTVQAATVQIEYIDGQQINVSDIIPSASSTALKAELRAMAKRTDADGNNYSLCKDDNNRTVCAIYEFGLKNSGSKVKLDFNIVPSDIADDVNQFRNLKYKLFDVTGVEEPDETIEDDAAATYLNGVFKKEGTFVYTKFNLLGDTNVELDENEEKTYRLFIWLDAALDDDNIEIAQDDEQGAVYKGTVNIDLVDGGIITGTID